MKDYGGVRGQGEIPSVAGSSAGSKPTLSRSNWRLKRSENFTSSASRSVRRLVAYSTPNILSSMEN